MYSIVIHGPRARRYPACLIGIGLRSFGLRSCPDSAKWVDHWHEAKELFTGYVQDLRRYEVEP